MATKKNEMQIKILKRITSTGDYTLCRCGASKKKPFCDEAHWMNSQQKLEFCKRWGLGDL